MNAEECQKENHSVTNSYSKLDFKLIVTGMAGTSGA